MGSDLHARLSDRLAFAPGATPELVVHADRAGDGYVERSVSYAGGEGTVPALLLVPEQPAGGAVLVHHQHHSQWHLGKSEVAGVLGDHGQAFGPALARRGVTVLAPDAVGFEDRRPGGPGTDARPSDRSDYWAAASHRLLAGRLLMSTVLADAAAGHAVLAALAGVDPTCVGALGHSMGGATALFHAALDRRVAFAAVSGAACTYRRRIADGTGIEAAQVIPGVLEVADLDDVAGLVAPRPLLLTSAQDDPYSRDAPDIAATAARAYRASGAETALRHERFPGGHGVTPEGFGLLVDWVAGQAGGRARPAGFEPATSRSGGAIKG